MAWRDDRPMAASFLVAAIFRFFCHIMLAPDATRLGATSRHLLRHQTVTAA
jgi:hypothetical protein